MKAITHIGLSWRGYDRPQGPKTHDALKRDQRVVKEILEKTGFGQVYNADQPYYNFALERGDKRLDRLVQKLRERPDLASPHIRVERLFTRQDLEEVPLLIWRITNQSIKDDHYDLSAKPGRVGPAYILCSVCRARLEQARDLILNPNHMGKKDVSLTYSFDVIFSERMAKLLEAQQVSGYTLRNVQNYGRRGADAPRLFQLQATNTLPPMSVPPTEFYPIRHCEACSSASYFLKHTHQWGNLQYYEDTDAYYPRAVVELAQDFNYTAEWFGELPIAKPMVIISQRLFRLLRENGIKHWEAVPVQLLD